MARKPRIHFPGALYHVICRGNQGQRIFRDDADRRRYRELLQENQKRYGFRLYAYVLMGNHVHHLIEVGQTPLSKIIQNVLFRYTRYWNRRNRKMGHLFQGRYKAIVCEKESYLLELIRYIHLNPVRSGIVRDPSRYAWSSHGAYLQGDSAGWVAVEEVLPRWGRRRAAAVAAYQRFVREGLREGHRADLYAVVDQRYLGNETFVEGVTRRVEEEEPPRAVKLEWGEVEEAVCKRFGVPRVKVYERGRERAAVRQKRVMAWVGRAVGGLTNQAMAKVLGQDPGALSRGMRKLAEELEHNRELKEMVQGLCESLREGRPFKKAIRHA
jgi:REP-associated tyrosine transposase